MIKNHRSIIAVILLLAGIGADRAIRNVPSADADRYHQHVLASASLMPTTIGSWIATDVAVPQAAVALLRPNLIVARRFQDTKSDQSFMFLLIQCRDARDMLGHFPPNCYPAQGWREESSVPADWRVDDLTIHGMIYKFSTDRREMPSRIVIYNFMILSDGTTCREMDDLENAAREQRGKIFGAAQVQFVFDADLNAPARQEILEQVVHANRETIQTIRQGS